MSKLIFIIVFSQIYFAQSNPLKSNENRKLFADFLFCEADYLRAAEEYESLDKSFITDTVLFKIAKSYSVTGNNEKALNYFSSIPSHSTFFSHSLLYQTKIHFINDDMNSLLNIVNQQNSTEMKKLSIAFYLKNNQTDSVDMISLPSDDDMMTFKNLYEVRKNPPYKSEVLAGILSAIIPGSGKIYTENYGDGITALLLTGLFTYLAYDNFQNAHKFRAYLFTGLATGFYLGNIYGSVASAQIFNAKVDFNFIKELTDFLIKKNYFISEYEFCK